MASLKDIIALRLKEEKVQPKAVGLVDNVKRLLTGAKSITEEYFEPLPDGRVRFRDVLRRTAQPAVSKARAIGEAADFAVGGAQSTVRSAAMPVIGVIGAINKVREIDGREPITNVTSARPDDQQSVFRRDLQKIFMGEDALESYSETNKTDISNEDSPANYVGRSAGRVFGANPESVTKAVAPVFIVGSVAADLLDFVPGLGAGKKAVTKGATEVTHWLSKLDNVDEIFDAFKRVDVPDEIARKYSGVIAKQNDPLEVTKTLKQVDKEVAAARSVFPQTMNFGKLTPESEDAILSGLREYQQTGFIPDKWGGQVNIEASGATDRLVAIMDKRALTPDELSEAANLLVRGGRQLPILEMRNARRIVSEEAYQAASKRFDANMKRLNSGIPLDQIPDFAVIAAYHIENGVKSLAEFTERMVKSGYDVPSETMQKLYDDALLAAKSAPTELPAGSAGKIGGAVDEGGKTLGFIDTAKKSPSTNPDVAHQIGGEYSPIKNEETLTAAQKLIDDNYDQAYAVATDKVTPLTADSVAVSLDLVRRAQNEGNYTLAVDIIENVALKAKNQGQAIQALSMWGRLTPEGILRAAQKNIDKFNAANPGKTPLKLDPDTAEKLAEKARKIGGMGDGLEKQKETARMLQDLTELTPPSFWRKVATYQTMAQLMNPKTIMRNVIGNAGFAITENVKDVFATALDSALSVVTGKRTKSLPDIIAQSRGAKEGFFKGVDDALSGVDTSGFNTQFDLPNTKTFRSGVGSKLETLMNVSLKAPDRAMYQAAYDGSLSSQMRAAKVDVATDEMIDIAHHDALYRTFQDDNATTVLFTGLKKLLNMGQEFGVGDIVLKYPKTPANLLNRGIAYSPAGFVKAMFEISRPLFGGKAFDQREFVETFSRALTGTVGLVGTGALMHRLGIITGKNKEDKDLAAIEKETGLGQYKINASALKRFVMSGFDPEAAKLKEGDSLYSYDWFQPAAMGIAIGSNIDEAAKIREFKGKDYTGIVETIVNGIASGINTTGEQPLLQGLTRLFKYGEPSDVITGLIKQIPSSMVPTLLNQINQLVDNTSKSTYDQSWIQEGLNAAKRRIPGYNQTLTPNVGVYGDVKETYQGGSNNLFNVLFNPAFKTVYKPTPESELVLSLYNETGEVKQAPRVVGNSVTVGGQTIKLGPKRKFEMQRFVGEASKVVFNELAQNEAFTQLPPEEQVKFMSNVLSDIGSAAKIAVLKIKPSKNPTKRTMDILNWYFAEEFMSQQGGTGQAENFGQGIKQITESGFDIQPDTSNR